MDSTIPEWPDAEVWPFLSAMRADPDDFVTPLVFADWLEERGDPRADMLRASCEVALHRFHEAGPAPPEVLARLAPWEFRGSLLEAWIGPMAECYFWVTHLRRGLLSVTIAAESGTREEDYPRFFDAFRQGWVDEAVFVGLPSDVFHSPPGVQSLLRGVDRLELVYGSHYPYALDDDVLSAVAMLPNLIRLSIEGCDGFTDAGLAHLRNHPRLEWIQLEGTFTAEGYAHLDTLPRLRKAAVGNYARR